MTQPAENHPAYYKKHECVPGVAGEVPEILYESKAGADQGGIDDTIGDIIKLIAQDEKKQKQAQPFYRLFCDASIQPIENITHDIAGVWTKEILYILLDEESEWNGNNRTP